MAWTPPKLFAEGEVLTARDLNVYLRDNLLENEVAKCTTAGSHLTTDTAGELIERKLVGQTVDASESTIGQAWVNSGGFTAKTFLGPVDLGTAGPSVTVETGTRALVFFSAKTKSTWPNFTGFNRIWVEVKGVTVFDLFPPSGFDLPGENQSLLYETMSGTDDQYFKTAIIEDLPPGLNTFTLRYNNGGNSGGVVSVSGGYPSQKPETSTYSNRRLLVFPL